MSERKYRTQWIEGLGEVQLPTPPSASDIAKMQEEAKTAPRDDPFALRTGDKVVYACLAIAAVLWLAGRCGVL